MAMAFSTAFASWLAVLSLDLRTRRDRSPPSSNDGRSICRVFDVRPVSSSITKIVRPASSNLLFATGERRQLAQGTISRQSVKNQHAGVENVRMIAALEFAAGQGCVSSAQQMATARLPTGRLTNLLR
jgi:hypothetical protein